MWSLIDWLWWNILILTYLMYECTLQYYKRSFVRRRTMRSTQLTPNPVFETWSILEYCVRISRILHSRIPPSPKESVTDTPFKICMGKEKQSKRSFLRPGFKPGPTDLKSELLTAWLPRRRLKTKYYFLKVKEFFPLKWASVVLKITSSDKILPSVTIKRKRLF